MAFSRTTSFGKRAVATPPARAVPAAAIAEPIAAPTAPLSPLARTLSRLPYFTVVLSLALIYRFKAELAAATDWDAPNTPGYYSLLAAGASGRQQILEHGEWWRLFTAASLHGSLDHLIGNLITFAIVGLLLEPMIGIGWFAAIYFTGGFAGMVLSMMINPANMLCVGASGAIMATLAALFTLSFHAGAPRPNLMRRVAAFSLFPAMIPAVTDGGAVVDVHAHLGGCLAGAAVAFVMLIYWKEENEHPPGRSFAAIVAGIWVALTVWAFSASAQTYVQYARDGLDYIPPNEMPKDMMSGSYALVEKYKKDPRAHMFRGLYFLGKQNAADAEPYFRNAIRLGEKSPMMGGGLRDWSVVLLALSVQAQRRPAEAHGIVAPVCARRDTLDRHTRETLQITRLC